MVETGMRKTWSILVDAVGTFAVEDGWAISSHIALSTLTSLFPFLIFVTALAGFLGTQDLADEATRLIFSAWPDAVARPIAGEVRDVLTAPRGGLLTIGVVLALYFSTSAIEALRVGLNRAYASPETRPWWWLRLQSLAFALVASAGLLALAFLVVLGPLIWSTILSFVPALAPLQFIVTFTRLGVATLLLAITLVIAHRWLPARRVRFIDIAPGVIATFASSIAFAGLFGVYLNEFARNYVSTYAGLASVMIALVFLYAMASLFVFGGALNAAIMRARESARRASATAP
jgi:membrane protein